MKSMKFTESQIIGVLNEQEQGKEVPDIFLGSAIVQLLFFSEKVNF
jgi:hypothetical protein